MRNSFERMERRGMADFIAFALEEPGFAEGLDAAVAQTVSPGEALRAGRRAVRRLAVGEARVGYGDIGTAGLLSQCPAGHFARDLLARQPEMLDGFLAHAEKAHFSARRVCH